MASKMSNAPGSAPTALCEDAGSPQTDRFDHDHTHETSPRGRYLLTLALGALGVVYGDIGTSPLYALRECFHGLHAIAPTPPISLASSR